MESGERASILGQQVVDASKLAAAASMHRPFRPGIKGPENRRWGRKGEETLVVDAWQRQLELTSVVVEDHWGGSRWNDVRGRL